MLGNQSKACALFLGLTLMLAMSLQMKANSIKLNADLIIYPDQDTYTSGGGDINGVKEFIVIDDWTLVADDIGFLKFPIEQIINANLVYLEMYNYIDEISTIGIYGVDNDIWEEISLSDQKDLPKATELLDTASIIGSGWYKWEVTSFVDSQDDGWVTFRLEVDDGPGHFQGHSKESYTEWKWPFLSVNGSIHSEDIPQKPIITTKTETVFTDTITTFTDTITTQIRMPFIIVLLSSIVIASLRFLTIKRTHQ